MPAPYNVGYACILTNDPQWQPDPERSSYAPGEIQLVFQKMEFIPTHMDLPQMKAARLEFGGKTYIHAGNQGIGLLQEIFSGAEQLSWEPKTHSIGMGLDLIFETTGGEEIRIELDPDEELCRKDGYFYSYHIPDVPNRIGEVWKALNISQWPDAVYQQCPNAYRPH